MIRKLWYHEVYKVLFSYGGLLLIAAFVILKVIYLCVLPELKDGRIKLSQRQYDRVLAEIHGETTSNKETYIFESYTNFKEITDRFFEIRDSYIHGKISEAEWGEYSKEYEQAMLYINAFEIFNEKREHFIELQPYGELMPPAYFYEYGWVSIFTYMGFPDPLSFLLVLLLAVLIICPEATSGAMKINFSTRYGRASLFLSKLFALTLLLCFVAAINAALEIVIFSIRFNLSEVHWSLYSVIPYASIRLPLSLLQGLVTLSFIRWVGMILTGVLTFTIACFTMNASQTIFYVILLVVIPWIISPELPFTMGAWLSGATVLKYEGFNLIIFIPFITIAIFAYFSYVIKIKRKTNKI